MALTLVVPFERLSLKKVEKNIRNEVNRGNREHLTFKEIPLSEHRMHLRRYRKRKHLLMLPFYRNDPRKFYGTFAQEGAYLCSVALYPHHGCLRIQAVSIDEKAPYYAFSWLIFQCLEKAGADGFRGLDLSSDGVWKRRWHPVEKDDGMPKRRGLFGGRVSRLVSKVYWFTEKRTDFLCRKIHGWMVRRWG